MKGVQQKEKQGQGSAPTIAALKKICRPYLEATDGVQPPHYLIRVNDLMKFLEGKVTLKTFTSKIMEEEE